MTLSMLRYATFLWEARTELNTAGQGLDFILNGEDINAGAFHEALSVCISSCSCQSIHPI